MKTVGVFFGGRSNEREISVITGMLAVNLLRTRYAVVPVYLSPEGGLETGDIRSVADFRRGAKCKRVPVRLEGRALVHGRKKIVLDCALNCCHGGMGEDGTLAAVFRFNGLPSASPEVPMSAIFMDKLLTKLVLRGLGIPVLRGFSVTEEDQKTSETVLKQAELFGYPVIVKPARLGSSIGVKVARGAEELAEALRLAFRLDERVLVEEYLAGKRDLNCAAYRANGKTVLSPVEEVFSDSEFLTFSEKYEDRGTKKSKLPADLEPEIAERIAAYTKTVYETFGGRGVVRADYLLAGGEVYFNELNTVPGSLSCYLFGSSLSKSRDFLVNLVEEAAVIAEKEVVVSGILEGEVFSGGKSAKRR